MLCFLAFLYRLFQFFSFNLAYRIDSTLMLVNLFVRDNLVF